MQKGIKWVDASGWDPHPGKLPTYEKELKKNLTCKREESKVCENAHGQGSIQALANRRNCQIWSYGFGFRVTDTKRLGNHHL